MYLNKPIVRFIGIYPFFIVYIFLSLGCTSSESNGKEGLKDEQGSSELKNYLSLLDIDTSHLNDSYFIIPSDICSSCIKAYHQYILTNDSEHITFILSGYSAKQIKLTFGQDVISKNNVVIDSKGLFYDTKLYKDAAQLFFLKGEEIWSVELTISNMEAELEKLDKFLFEVVEMPSDKNENEFRAKLERVLNSPTPFDVIKGELLPKINGTTIEGLSFDSSWFKNKPLIINFWSIHCAPCFLEVPQLNELSRASGSKEFTFVSVCVSSKDEFSKFMREVDGGGYKLKDSNNEKQTIHYPIIINGEQISESLGITAYPTTIVVDRNKQIRYIVGYTEFVSFPDKMVTYELLKLALDKIGR